MAQTTVGIVGTGISGLTLALQLQQSGIATTVYADRGPDELRSSRLPNSVARFGRTQARERALGIDDWADAEHTVPAIRLVLGNELQFTGRLDEPMSAIDFRIYLPRLLEEYAQRGGDVRIARDAPAQVGDWAARHDLLVVASGRETAERLFPRDPARSVHSAPQRRLCAGLYRGIMARESVIYAVAPGAGEIFAAPFHTFDGRATSLLVEAIPGGPLEPITRMPNAADGTFEAVMLELLETFAPAIAEHVDRAAFGLTRPQDLLQGAITPTVRRPWAELDGRFVLGIGDAWVLNDPIVAQGANLGSATAWHVGEAIREHGVFDELFRADVERRMWAAAQPAIDFTNMFLAPPPPYVLELLEIAAHDRPVADAFVSRFGRPDEMWRAIASPERAAAFLARTRTRVSA